MAIRWHDLIRVSTLADAILDRVIHNAYRIRRARGRPARPTLGAARPWITAGCATAQWKARFARRYPPPLEPPLANRAFSSFCEGLNPGRLTHPAKRKQLRHQNLAQPTMCGVVASRLMPDRINRQRR
jgi:hypothetical protein